MGKRAKNPAQLTEEEKDTIDRVIVVLGAAYADIIRQGPKSFAEKMISFTKAMKKIASSYLFSINSRNMEFGQVVTPATLNTEIAKTMLDDTNVRDPSDITADEVGASKIGAYINSTDMTKILHVLTLGDIYRNIKGRKEVRHQIKRGRRGKPKKSDMTFTKLSGRPSVYGINKKVEKLKVLVSKPEACDRIRKVLVDSGLVYKYEKFLVEALYYTARKDTSAVDKFVRLFVSPDLAKEFKTFLENLCSLDKHELDRVADKVARIAIENHGYDGFLFLGGLFDIASKVTRNFIL